jgi:hypothetical protein
MMDLAPFPRNCTRKNAEKFIAEAEKTVFKK